MEKARILIVEDKAIMAMEIESQLQNLGYEITSIVDNGDDAIKKAEEDKPDLILMDIHTKGELDGIDTAEIICNRLGIPVVFSTAYLDEERIERAKITMPFRYVMKPIRERDLRATIEMALYVTKVDPKQKKIENNLRMSEKQLSMIYDNTSNYMALFEVEAGKNTRLVSINKAYAQAMRMLNPNLTRNDVKGLLMEDMCKNMNLPQEFTNIIKGYHIRALESKKEVRVLEEIPSINGIIYLQDIYSPILDGNGNCTHVLFVATDITELKKKELELENLLKQNNSLRNYLSNIIDSMPSSLVGVDPECRVTQWNKNMAQATGTDEEIARGKFLTHLLPWMTSEMESITNSIKTRQVIQEEKRPRLSDSGTCYENITIFPLVANGVEGAVIRIDDVTEKVHMEELLVQSEKMMSIGGLAAGMAHEINNPLAGMLQTADVIANRLAIGSEIPANYKAAEEAGTTLEAIKTFMEARKIPRMLDAIRESGRRIVTIVNNMLSFARKSDATFSSYSLEEVLEETLELAVTDYDMKKEYDFKLIEIVKEYENNLPVVTCESAKIKQVLLNILTNGAQAMQMAGIEQPQLTVRTMHDKDRNMVCIEIEDNGPGMTETTLKKIFEPFYTTKPVGVGTGLGLSVSYFIITDNHGGEMDVESNLGKGSKFIIRLPLNSRSSQEPVKPPL
jgi:PAS domain S-box-containing protein